MRENEIVPVKEEPKLPLATQENWPDKIARLIERFITEIPGSHELTSDDPKLRAEQIIRGTALKAGATSGGLAIPPGPAGYLTIIPDLIIIWKLQAQMVADIAAVYGKTGSLSREQMLYCLFRHAASQAVRDIVMRVGDRYLLRQTTLRTVQNAIKAIVPRVTQRTIKGALARVVPILGAAGVGAYAFYDTRQVGKTAMDLFSKPLELEGDQAPPDTRPE